MGTGVKWATMNVGAGSETDPGNYFSWGETKPKEDYSSSTYQYSGSTSPLPSDDDAATQNWGGSWRMPTPEDWSKLAKTSEDSNNYVWTWCDGSNVKYNNSNVSGWKIERKSTGATLFLPAAGYKKDNTGSGNGLSAVYFQKPS